MISLSQRLVPVSEVRPCRIGRRIMGHSEAIFQNSTPEKQHYRNVGIWAIRLAAHIPTYQELGESEPCLVTVIDVGLSKLFL
jgi:hypothetical protein